MAVDRFVRFRDLKARGLLSNHVTLGRWIKYEGFPPGMMLGPNTRVWTEAEIEAWIASRPTENTAPLKGFAKTAKAEVDACGGGAE
jgi:predicted DNA-binding transcriptional regulator AlpA